MPTCNGKIKAEDGEVDSCPCARYIPDPMREGSGPRNCRDCLHFESAHPTSDSQSTVSSVLASLKTRIDTVRRPSSTKITPAVSEEEARQETNAGFRKVSNSNTDSHGGSGTTAGRGGATKYKVR